MINHARTLILNELPKDRPDIDVYGEEYIPNDFKPLTLPNAEKKIRSILLGTETDPFYQNFMLAKIMSILHANEVSREYILGLDSRFTYNLDNSSVLNQEFGAIVTEVDVTSMKLKTTGIGAADDVDGISAFSWKINTSGSNEVKIFDYWTGKTKTVTVDFTDGQTDPIGLNNGMQFVITGSSWIPSELWGVYALSRPTKSLGKALNTLTYNTESEVSKILSSAPTSFKALWLTGNSLVDRMAGILASLVYRLEDLYEY